MYNEMTKKKTIEETYMMLSQHEHVMKRPDTYIGSVNKQTSCEWVYDTSTSKIVKKNVVYTPGFLKIFDEIVSNATDHSSRTNLVTKIDVTISKEDGKITVKNDGPGIPVVIHQEHNVYVPEMIFSNLLTGSNYDDNEQRTGVGRNGLGATLTVIFSKWFKVVTVDTVNNKKFSQEYTNNMMVKSTQKVTDITKGKSYTEVSFIPDFEKFEMTCIDDDTYSLLVKRVYDCVATTAKNVSISLNGVKIPGKGLIDYARFLFDEKPLAHDIQGKWEYLIYKNSNYEQISFVNGNNTSQGGKHVDYILNQVVTALKVSIETKKKIQNVKPSVIKENFFLILNCVIPNPRFNSQTKDILSTPVKDFGSSVSVSESFVKKIYSSSITQEIIEVTSFKDRKKLDKEVSNVKKTKMIVKNLEDATNAGTSKSKNCELILTEGLSASSFAISGLSVIGRANYGVMAMQGKVLNIREATQAQLIKNEEIINLKKIIGLQCSKKYDTEEEFSTLRYGGITILADADHDGQHISGLIMNFIHYWWPELIKRPGFIKSIRTPIVKISKGTQVMKFYDETSYLEFIRNNSTGWKAKYYKGLGTSTSQEAKETFKDINSNTGIYIEDENMDKSFNLAFNKKMADDRKVWLEYVPDEHAQRNNRNEIKYSDFINKELIHFSNYDNIRSIPHIMDGMKPSQRKVMYTALKKNLTKEMKVAQFGASVAEETAYHHGEVSLSSTIISMAQNYTGSNNINLLEPCGNFGFRNHNGKDSASPRYIFTYLTENTRNLFVKDDEAILTYNTDDGKNIEPKFYTPSIPLILVNGSIGIGTGYSTNIPCFNPSDIIKNMKLILDDKHPDELIPWYNGFKGTITKDENSYIMRGVYKKSGKIVHITEIPINISISDYKDFLENHEEFSTINNSTENNPDFTLKFKNESDIGKFNYKTLKLEMKINITNMHLFNTKGKIKKYDDPNDIIREFLECKIEYTQKRKEHLVNVYDEELHYLLYKKKFLEDIIENKIDIYRKSKSDIQNILITNGYPKIKDSYSYLTSLPVSSFTSENLLELSENIKTIKHKRITIQTKSPAYILFEDIKNLKI